MKRLMISATVCLLAVGTFSLYAAEEKAEKTAVKCPVSGKDVVDDQTVEYKGAVLKFCCPNCPKAFTANPEKFATKANLQLVATKQAKQIKCPLTGRDMAADKTVSVGGVEVAVCCPNCLAKANKAEGDEQLALLLSDKAFEKGFEIVKKDK